MGDAPDEQANRERAKNDFAHECGFKVDAAPWADDRVCTYHIMTGWAFTQVHLHLVIQLEFYKSYFEN